jgi:hypothetical protein
MQHLFCECLMAREVWKQVGNWIQAASLMPENWDQTADMGEWFTGLVTAAAPSVRPGMRSMATLTIWELWIERNSRVFKKVARSVQQIVYTIQDEARTWAFAGNRGLELLLPAPVFIQTCCLQGIFLRKH